MTVEIIEMIGENVLKLGRVDNEVKDTATTCEALRTLDPFGMAGLPIRLHSLFDQATSISTPPFILTEPPLRFPGT